MNIASKRPTLSNAYNSKPLFYVISYEEHNGKRELISDTFASLYWAQAWVKDHKDEFDHPLIIHTGQLTGEQIGHTHKFTRYRDEENPH